MDVVETRLFIQDPGGHDEERENGRSSTVALQRWPDESRRKQLKAIDNHQPGQWDG